MQTPAAIYEMASSCEVGRGCGFCGSYGRARFAKKVVELRSAGRVGGTRPYAIFINSERRADVGLRFKMNLQRYISVLLGRVFVTLGVEHF